MSFPFVAHIQYRRNALNAAVASRSKFGMNSNQCQDNSCNAFKHVYFSALNAYTFSPDVSKELGEAREGMTLQTCNCGTQGANFMDLVNNQHGYVDVHNMYSYQQPEYYDGLAKEQAYYMATHNQLITNPNQCP